MKQRLGELRCAVVQVDPDFDCNQRERLHHPLDVWVVRLSACKAKAGGNSLILVGEGFELIFQLRQFLFIVAAQLVVHIQRRRASGRSRRASYCPTVIVVESSFSEFPQPNGSTPNYESHAIGNCMTAGKSRLRSHSIDIQ